jgi:hypothetical protein
MRLDIRGKSDVRNPTPQDITTAIRSMTQSDDPFLILEKDGDGFTYIQAILEDNSRWVVEYQDGGLARHFQASNVDTEDVVEMFLAYANNDERWRDAVTWARIEL